MLRSRIAPTPSGYLHIGNALNFVITWLWTRKENGIVRLRIDDRSLAEVNPIYLNDIFDTLHWLGIDWDEGPRTPQEQQAIYSEHLQTDLYAALIDRLVQSGQVFACTCSRKAINTPGYLHPEPCPCRLKGIALHQPDVAWRIITPENLEIQVPDVQHADTPVNLFNEMHDFIIRRKDGVAAYQVVSLADDIKHQSNFIIRGMDLLPSTAAQLFLADLIGDTVFKQAKFYHHPLLKDHDGEKLSKSAGSKALKSWGPQTTTPEEFYRWLSGLLGWKEQATSLSKMLQFAKQGFPLFIETEKYE